MGRQDYILRMIEMAGRALRQLVRALLLGETSPSQARDRLRATADEVGLDLDLLRSTDLDTLVLLVSPGGEPEPGRTWIGAELFAADAVRAELEGDVEGAVDACHRALRLYALVDPALTAGGLTEVPERVAEVRAHLDRLEAAPT